MTTAPATHLNPWLSIWIKPRATIQEILNSKSSLNNTVYFLAACWSLARTLDRMSRQNPGGLSSNPTSTLLFGAVTIILGPILLYLHAAALRWTGSWIGGKATTLQIFIADAWGNIAAVPVLLLWIPQLLILGPETFSGNASGLNDLPLLLQLLILGFSSLQIVFSIWGFIVMLNCLAQAQKFSIWKALANHLMVILLLILLVLPLAIFTWLR